MHISSRKELRRVRRMLDGLSIYDKRRDRLRYTESELMPIYCNGHLYNWSNLENCEVIKELYRYRFDTVKIVRDEYGVMWLYSYTEDRSVVSAFEMVSNPLDGENLFDKHGAVYEEWQCRPPYFFNADFSPFKCVKPIPVGLSEEDEFRLIVEHTKML